MRQPGKAKKPATPFFLLLLVIALMAPPVSSAKEYFSEDELDLIRAAQELRLRVPAYIKLAERRLKFLGIMEKSEKEQEQEKKSLEQRLKDLKDLTKGLPKKGGPADTKKPDTKKPVDDLSYLDEFTPAELLLGYVQALDEIHTNIDDAYSRKLDVREALEDLEKFTRETIPLLEKYKPRNSADRAALEEAFNKARESQADTKEALKIVPKTEKKRQQP